MRLVHWGARIDLGGHCIPESNRPSKLVAGFQLDVARNRGGSRAVGKWATGDGAEGVSRQRGRFDLCQQKTVRTRPN